MKNYDLFPIKAIWALLTL